MADRLQYNAPSVMTDRVREVSYDDGTVNFMQNLSGAFLSIADKAHRSQLESEVAQARKEGILHGSSQGANFKPSERKGIVHKTYNDSGIQSATVKMSLGSQRAVQRIASENPANPFAQEEQMKAWADTFAEKLPSEMIAPFRENFEQLAYSQLTKANREYSDLRQSEAIAEFNDLEVQFTNSVENYAPRMFDNGEVGTDAAKAIETLRKNYIELLAQNGPSAEYSVSGYTIPEGAGRSNTFSVEEIGAKIKEFDKMVLTSATKGSFLRDLENGRGVDSYFNFVKGNTAITTVTEDGTIKQVPVTDVLDNSEKESVASFMRTHISSLNSMEAAEERKSDRAREDYNNAIMDQALQVGFGQHRFEDGRTVIHGNPDMLRMLYLQTVNDETGMVDFKTVEDIQSLMEVVGTGDIADPAVVSKTKLDIVEGNIKRASQLPAFGLGDQARAEMIQMTAKINAGQHWSNSKRYTTMIDLGKAALAPAAATGFNLFSDPNKESAADFAEFKETLMNDILAAEMSGILPADINSLPSKDEFDIQVRAKEIIAEIKERRATKDQDPEVTEINNQIKVQEELINNVETGRDELKKARDELKRLLDEKARIQSNAELRSMGNR